jgi:hypothetical protein
MFYQERHEAKGAVIGTIMAWTGGLSSIPHGWVICNGGTLPAVDYPLLAATIGDSYNMGDNSGFVDTFPLYGGTITLPDLNGRMLMDIENDYFALTGRDADNDIDARTIMSNIIGDKKENREGIALTGSYTDITTDIVFQISPSDRSGYQGKISGNTKIDGDGAMSVYVAPRKLGRKHIGRHNHSGLLETIDNSDRTKPGLGVVPYHPIPYTLYVSAVDLDGESAQVGEGDAIFFGWVDSSVTGRDSAEGPSERSEIGSVVNIRPGFMPGLYENFQSINTRPNDDQSLLSIRWPEGISESPDGKDDGSPNKIYGLARAESPPVNLKPKQLHWTPLTSAFLTTDEHPGGAKIGGGTEGANIPFGPLGGRTAVPLGYRNYFTTNQPSSDYEGRTLLSHPAYEFLPSDQSGISDGGEIYAHDHGSFEVIFDSTRLNPQSSVIANVNLPSTTNPDNSENEKALKIDFTTAQPKLTCIYIIRAY